MTPPSFVITLAFNPVEMMRESLKRMDETIGLSDKEFLHIIVDQYYPREREKILGLLEERKKRPNTIILDPGKNLGIERGVNFALNYTGVHPDDVFIFFDPDCFPREKGWGIAIEEVLKEKHIGWVSLFNSQTERETTATGFTDRVINGINVRGTHGAVVNSVCGLSGDFLLKSKGVHEPNPYYGGFELSMWDELEKAKLAWVFLKDFFTEDPPEELVDKDYREYKFSFCHGAEKGQKQIEFGEWLNKNGKA